MEKSVNIHEAKTHLSRLIGQVEAGEEITLCRAGRPVARLVPYAARREPRQPGFWKGKLWLADNWDSPEVNADVAALFDT